MQARIYPYVACVAAAAALAVVGAVWFGPTVAASMGSTAAILCVLAIAGELLGFVLPQGAAMGSIGFIPFFAAAILVPGWPSIVGVALVRLGLEALGRRQPLKLLLNLASQTLMEAIAVLVYLGLGGASLLTSADRLSLTRLTQHYGFAALIAFMAAFFANNLIVFAAIALASGRKVTTVWLENSRSTVVIDLITTPLIFVFAWVFAAFGPIAAAALWVPILGLRQVHRINIELERSNEELLELMVKSIEARDPYTSGHSRRVQHYSVIIGRAIGLSDSQIAQVGRAALLHDIGKIYEKYASVLQKEDKLTPDEWAIIQEHPVDGANLVATMSRLRDCVPPIRHHHENWDGTGYPDGLAGELIPLAARIIRFADTIDAMTTERPYRKPLTEAQVRAEIISCRGSQFDPLMADRLLSSGLWHSLFTPMPGVESRTLLTVVPSTRSVTANRAGSNVRRA